jgi:MiaB/RimO family radical SAM methylthiotransferase
LKIVTGCDGRCTYCAIRFAKGRVTSKPFVEIRREFAAALSRGYRHFVLVGDEISAYGRDLAAQTTVLDVVDMLSRHPKVEAIYPESFTPDFMIAYFDKIQNLLAGGKIPVFCSSVQSGSNRILRLMKREYTVEEFTACMQDIRINNPALSLRTEIIVGFPGETDDDFAASHRLVARLKPDFVRAHIYEDRPSTPASRMPDKIPENVKHRRRRQIIRQHWKNHLSRTLRPSRPHKDAVTP